MGGRLSTLSDALKNDPEFVLAVVQRYGRALQCASNSMKNDREIVLAAVQQNGWALEWASDELKNDPEIVMAAVQQDWRALEVASDAFSKLLKNSCTQKHARAMARKDIRILHLLNEKHRGDMAWLLPKTDSKALLLSGLRPVFCCLKV